MGDILVVVPSFSSSAAGGEGVCKFGGFYCFLNKDINSAWPFSSFAFSGRDIVKVRAREAPLKAVGGGREINKRDITLTLPSRARLVFILNIFLGRSRESYG